jgi:SAM-dependent methyltransferase
VASSERWGNEDVVGSFAAAPPNANLIGFARAELQHRAAPLRVLDIGCGAARNAVPLAALGATVVGCDLVPPMLSAARERAIAQGVGARVHLVRATMDRLPLRSAAFDLVVAHGIWNLARSRIEFRAAVAEAARVALPGAGLFVFTFSRSTLAPAAEPVAGESFVFTQFSGEPQCFLTEHELLDELAAAGFRRDPPGALAEHNKPRPGHTLGRSGPVILEGTFRRSD